jgi:hypothetical protein
MLSWEEKQFLSGDKIVEHLVVSPHLHVESTLDSTAEMVTQPAASGAP